MSLDVAGLGSSVGLSVVLPGVWPDSSWQVGPLVVYPAALQSADEREEVLVWDGGGGDGRACSTCSTCRPHRLGLLHPRQAAPLVLDSRPLHLHQLLEEVVVRQTVLVRGGHTQSLQYFRLFRPVQTWQDVPRRSLLIEATGLGSGDHVEQLVLGADTHRGHGDSLLLEVRQRTPLVVHPLGLEPETTETSVNANTLMQLLDYKKLGAYSILR